MKKYKKVKIDPFERGLLWVLSVVMVFVLVVLCISCGNIPIKNHKEAEISVFNSGKVVENQTILIGKKQEIHFSFVQGITEGMQPKIYIYGPIYAKYIPSLEPDIVQVKANVGYMMRVRFNRPGEAIIMFIWEGHGAFGNSITLYLKYKGE